MAKVKVLNSFIDKYTGSNHPVDEVFEADEERIAEIRSVDAKLIVVLPEEVAVKKTKRKKEGE